MTAADRDTIDREIDKADLLVERDRIVARYNEINSAIHTWGIKIGPWRWVRPVHTGAISIIFALWHLSAFATGVLITILWEGGKELGVALVVGALFGVGSFLSQMWSQGMDRQREFVQRVEFEDELSEMRGLIRKFREIENELNTHRG
ncbi:hypothetical protein ABZ863_30040 [Saccharomonospora sp. NPDC046836]|uniref:hypothetical protein n=1 Tax=Saccharomonospora sp. NPDC046836 TaxID=3156921 RepID=UPI0033EA9DF8